MSKKCFFFQRDIGASAKKGVFIYDKNKLYFIKIQLPEINNIEATFTDAIFVDDLVYFLALVENTVSTYDDGEILGCFVGCMSLKASKIIFTHKISDTNKFKGLTLFEKSENKIDLLLCEDNDTYYLRTKIFKLSLLNQ